jgi:transcriptional regulator with XRE-family HTH domain
MKARRPTTETPLLKARLDRDLRQRDLALALGISQPWYSDIERGKTTPDVILAQRIAAEVGATVAELWPALGAEVSQ